ncbi:MAG: NADPH-dependent assimilatory sulfite reductase hemoprotein subunit [Verrucomicrobia bacterium]|nr:NADPH-dependent assimilatory sulfite reductase hemoprotein subunit [Verrucomicrobiota bacterium]MBV9672600.1 NADPH-dependent assimilatory sulfite reductase hemoprotein subunit [Verrucomicrobiota bacterium]
MPSKSVEEIKAESRALRGTIQETLHNDASHFSEEEYQLLKFHGTYQQDDRDQRVARKKQNLDKAWIFMVRSKMPGGALSAEQYLQHDHVAGQLGNGTLRITTRQGFQLHGVLKGNLQDTINRINESGITTWGACGDVVRNTIAPAAPFRDAAHNDAQTLAKKISDTFLARTTAYAEIWLNGERFGQGQSEDPEPIYGKHYLPRKFKIGIAVPPRNDVDIYSNDLGFISRVEHGVVEGYTVVAGGGFGMSHGKLETFPALAQPLFYIAREHAVQAAVAVVTAQRDYGNRADRKRARLKYLIDDRGIEWFRAEVISRLNVPVDESRTVAWDTVSDYLGWHDQGDGKLFCGIWIEEGRIKDGDGPQWRTAFREIARKYRFPIRLTTNCNILFHDIDPKLKGEINALLSGYGVPDPGDLTEPRRLGQACVALPTCGLALAESERVFHLVLDRVDELLREFGLEKEPILIRMTGCPNGCSRPYNADVAFVGRAPGKYAYYVGGSITGERLAGLQEKTIGLDEIPGKIRELLADFVAGRRSGETFSSYWGRTHANGPAPRPEQFHLEFAERQNRELVAAEP